jgi:hypothetical protein
MEDSPENRMAEPRRRGRPPKSANVPTEQFDALPVVLEFRHVPPLNCPKCRRGMAPRVLRWTGNTAMCSCALCGGRFDYDPPKVRPLE